MANEPPGLPLLRQREIEARIVGPLIRAFAAEVGEERTIGILRRVITDLAQRGLLDSTLVMISSEFGRTPKINGTAGRDHWPKVFSVVLAGGGIKKGIAYGTSDATATEPEDDPLDVDALSQTVYHCLGIPGEKKLMSPGDRPQRIVDGGKPVKELLA